MGNKTLIRNEKAEEIIENLRWNSKRYGFTQEMQAKLLGCTTRNINTHYRNKSFSAIQFLMLQEQLNQIMEEKRRETENV